MFLADSRNPTDLHPVYTKPAPTLYIPPTPPVLHSSILGPSVPFDQHSVPVRIEHTWEITECSTNRFRIPDLSEPHPRIFNNESSFFPPTYIVIYISWRGLHLQQRLEPQALIDNCFACLPYMGLPSHARSLLPEWTQARHPVHVRAPDRSLHRAPEGGWLYMFPCVSAAVWPA